MLENVDCAKSFTAVHRPENERIVKAVCGYYHTLLLTESGTVLGAGRNDYGQVRCI